jgi:HEAT repeat protein
LLRALRDPRTRALPEYVQLVQRVALVSAPSNETVAFAQESFERLHATPPKDQEDADLRTASVYTLGSVAGHMAATGRRDGAERLCARIVQEMDRGTGSPKSAYITALGNAGVPAQEPLLLRLSDDGSSETRVSAINALRKYDDATTRARLLAILTARIDPARRVDADTQAEALRALMLMTPTRADVQRIAAAIVKDTLHRDLYGEVVPLFRRGIAPYPDVKAALDAMFVRSAQKDNDLQSRIDTLRAELSAKAP